ncbi:MAG TPA: hypothetical protein VM325_18410 [Alphaproteobacteria bacterium]|nr:hypothetical protein [Alphaproteobacteria bacterium]
MTEPPEEREFGPPLSRNKRLIIGLGMIAAFVGIIALAFFSSAPSG